jgi:chemotaxis protein MotB
MGNKRFYLGLFLACLLILGCESKEKYAELEASLSDTQAKLEQKNQQVKELELKLRESEENRNKGQQNTAELQARYESLEKTQQQLSQTLKETKLELDKKNAIVQQKEEMVQQLDDAKRQLETNMGSQIEAREKKIAELEKAISELDKAKRNIETNLMDLKEQNTVQEQKLIEQGNIIAELDATRLTQEQKIIEQRNIIAELDATRLTIEDTLQLRKSQLEVRGKKIEEMENTIAQLDKTKHQIETNLQKQIKAQQVKLEEMEGKLKVTFVDKILFSSGSVMINQEGKDLLLTLAGSFKQNKNHNIIVQGHTDNLLIKPEFRDIYPTNWELSVARSTAVVRYLQDKAGINPERLVASGYSFYKPIASNLTEEGQQQNRRIEIILAPPR